jgi:hypothetical protein
VPERENKTQLTGEKTMTQIKIETTNYKRCARKEPQAKQFGRWAFGRDFYGDTMDAFFFTGTYSEAKKAAKDHFKAQAEAAQTPFFAIYLLY